MVIDIFAAVHESHERGKKFVYLVIIMMMTIIEVIRGLSE